MIYIEWFEPLLKTKPYEYQLQGIKYGLTNNRFILADQMGLGKTKQVIDIATIKKNKNNYKHCLIICGINGLKWNWFNEINTHSDLGMCVLGSRKNKKNINNADKYEDLCDIDNLPYFLITNIESLRYKIKNGKRIKKKGKYIDDYDYVITDKIVELCEQQKINMIAVDECHVAKNPDSEQGKQLLRISAETEIAMTGTPLLNSPLDLFVPLKWLGYVPYSFFQYKVFYCKLGGYGGHEIIGYKHLDVLTKLLDRVMLRRKKEDVLDLPEKIFINEYVEMNEKQQKIYDEIKKELLQNVDKISKSVNPLSELIRLRQATGHTDILSTKISESAKLDRLVELVKEIVDNGEKVVIFSNWTDMTSIICKALSSYNPAVITGKINDSDRMSEISRFQTSNRCNVIIGTIGAMGTGLNLTASNNVIFFDEPWTCGVRDQAVDRCHRIGTKNNVNIITLLTKGTIDERVHSIVESKGELSDKIVDKKEQLKFLLS